MRDTTIRDGYSSVSLLFFLLTIIIRVPFTCKLLYHMNPLHFAVILRKYDMTMNFP
jgi:hypothetical protein